jgi:hypothetical protein
VRYWCIINVFYYDNDRLLSFLAVVIPINCSGRDRKHELVLPEYFCVTEFYWLVIFEKGQENYQLSKSSIQLVCNFGRIFLSSDVSDISTLLTLQFGIKMQLQFLFRLTTQPCILESFLSRFLRGKTPARMHNFAFEIQKLFQFTSETPKFEGRPLVNPTPGGKRPDAGTHTLMYIDILIWTILEINPSSVINHALKMWGNMMQHRKRCCTERFSAD